MRNLAVRVLLTLPLVCAFTRGLQANKVEEAGHGFAGPEVSARVKAFLDKHLLGEDVAVSAESIQASPAEPEAK